MPFASAAPAPRPPRLQMGNKSAVARPKAHDRAPRVAGPAAEMEPSLRDLLVSGDVSQLKHTYFALLPIDLLREVRAPLHRNHMPSPLRQSTVLLSRMLNLFYVSPLAAVLYGISHNLRLASAH